MHLKEKPPGIFYGWWVVVASFFIAVYTGGVVFFGFTAIFEPIAHEFGWEYAQVSVAASLRGLEMGFLAPVVGILVDRLGPRRLIVGGVFIVALGLFLLSRTSSLAMFYLAFGVMSIGVSASTSTVLMAAVANWFRRRVGVATGVAASGFGFGGILIPVIVRLIHVYDWRTTMVILAAGILAVGLPLSLLIRHRPEQYGYLPDGDTGDAVAEDKIRLSAQVKGGSKGISSVLKSRVFWHISMTLTVQMTVVMAVITHVMPYLTSVNIGRSVSGVVAMAIPLVSIAGRLSVGWLGDKFDKRWVTASAFVLMILGLICFEYASAGRSWLLVPFLIFFGISFGGNVPMRVALLMEYFGRRNFGTILGFALGIIALVSMVGPPLAGWVFDTWGSYRGTWLAFVGLSLIGTAIMVTTPPASTSEQP